MNAQNLAFEGDITTVARHILPGDHPDDNEAIRRGPFATLAETLAPHLRVCNEVSADGDGRFDQILSIDCDPESQVRQRAPPAR